MDDLRPETIEGSWRLILTQPGVAEHRPMSLTVRFDVNGTFEEQDYCHAVTGTWAMAADRRSVQLTSDPRPTERCVDTTDYLGTPLSAAVRTDGRLDLVTDARTFFYER
jgi:hypothetical protein